MLLISSPVAMGVTVPSRPTSDAHAENGPRIADGGDEAEVQQVEGLQGALGEVAVEYEGRQIERLAATAPVMPTTSSGCRGSTST